MTCNTSPRPSARIPFSQIVLAYLHVTNIDMSLAQTDLYLSSWRLNAGGGFSMTR